MPSTERLHLRHEGQGAYYSPRHDYIQMPDKWRFDGQQERYLSSLLHEMTHLTVHRSRLNRDIQGGFGSRKYAKEELVAELGACFLCASLGISMKSREDHACYLNNWLQVLKNDTKAIFKAARLATQAAEYLQNATAIEQVA